MSSSSHNYFLSIETGSKESAEVEMEESGEIVENGRAGSESIGSQPSISSTANASISGRTTPGPTLQRVASQVKTFLFLVFWFMILYTNQFFKVYV